MSLGTSPQEQQLHLCESVGDGCCTGPTTPPSGSWQMNLNGVVGVVGAVLTFESSTVPSWGVLKRSLIISSSKQRTNFDCTILRTYEAFVSEPLHARILNVGEVGWSGGVRGEQAGGWLEARWIRTD